MRVHDLGVRAALSSAAAGPPLCGCCGSQCPVLIASSHKEEIWLEWPCWVCECDSPARDHSSWDHVVAVWDVNCWAPTDMAVWQFAESLDAARAGVVPAPYPNEDQYRPAGKAWAVAWLATERNRPRPSPLPPAPARCRNPKHRAPARCGHRFSPSGDLRATHAWQDLVGALRDADLLDLPRVLATSGEGTDHGLFLTAEFHGFGPVQSPQLCAFQLEGSGGFLSVDAFTLQTISETRHPAWREPARALVEAWLAEVDDPTLLLTAVAALSAAHWRQSVPDLLRAHQWLAAAQLPDGPARLTARALIEQGTTLSAEELTAVSLDVAGVAPLPGPVAVRTPRPPEPVPVADWVVWDV